MSKKAELTNELKELAGGIKDFAKRYNDNAESFTAEEEANYNKINERYEDVKEELDQIAAQEAKGAELNNRAEEVAAQLREGSEYRSMQRDVNTDRVIEAVENEVHRRAVELQAFMQARSGGEYSDEVIKASNEGRINLDKIERQRTHNIELCKTKVIKRMQQAWQRGLLEQRAMVGGANDGAELVPEGFVNDLEVSMLHFGGVRPVARVIRTATGNPLPYPTIDDTSNTGEVVGAGAAATDSNDPATNNVTFNAYKYGSGIVRVAHELITDSAFNLSAELSELLGTRVARKQNTDFTVGDGSSKATGIVTGAAAGFTAAAAAALTMDEVAHDLPDEVDEAYARNGAFMMRRQTKTALRKLKDSEGRYLWEPRVQPGAPDILNGYPVYTNQDMAALAASAVTVLFGDFSKYVIRDVASISIRMSEHRYFEEGETAWVAELRSDGKILDAGTDPIKKITMAAS